MERAPTVPDLVRMRMAGDVAGLCRASRSEDHDVAVHAMQLLGGCEGRPEAVEALLDCLRWRDQRNGMRWQAARSLGRLRERRAVPELLRLLTDAEERDGRGQLYKPACDALIAIGGPQAVRGLVGLCGELAAGRGHWTVRVLDALARLRPPEAVAPLLVALWEYLPERAERVVRTLGAIGDPRAASALLVLAHSPASDVPLRRAAVAALHALPEADWPPGHQWPSAAQLLQVPQRDPDPETTRLATALLARTEDGRDHLWNTLRAASGAPPHAVAAVCAHVAEEPGRYAVPDPGERRALLRHHLRESPVPSVRRAAARALFAYAGAAAGEALLEALGDAPLSDTVADLVAQLPDPPLRQLLDLLTGTSCAVAQRQGAARALGAVGQTPAVPALLAVLADEEAPAALRTDAVDALGALRHPEAAAPLAALAQDEERPGTPRARAVRALGLIGAPETLPVVLACTDSPHEAVRARAVAALGGFPVARAAQALRGLVTPDADPDLARAALRALGRIGAPALPALVELADAVREDVAAELVAALAARPEAEALAALGRLAASPSAQRAAADALSARSTPDCAVPLASFLHSDVHPFTREAAVRGLLRIGTDEAHEHVLAHCLAETHLYHWHVEALDVIAEARGVRLGP
ncbi:HEAT repeat domain-containing protein [Streptomyces spectabilis]|uniref:HEAT repeat domain-containing protein n=1 Tax=Streptomyces spectabilis TaxID=68270 RepID=A0A516REY9_STRST|nr:HEAT repeat domain-containing protein [Streptomyces spectabilis]QDQ14226.1 HEAT repeat domain-containing protein [Streptomyces spectabilis]